MRLPPDSIALRLACDDVRVNQLVRFKESKRHRKREGVKKCMGSCCTSSNVVVSSGLRLQRAPQGGRQHCLEPEEAATAYPLAPCECWGQAALGDTCSLCYLS